MSQALQATDYVLGLPSRRRFPRRQEALRGRDDGEVRVQYAMAEVEITSPITFDSTVVSVQSDCRAYGEVNSNRIPKSGMTPTCWRCAESFERSLSGHKALIRRQGSTLSTPTLLWVAERLIMLSTKLVPAFSSEGVGSLTQC